MPLWTLISLIVYYLLLGHFAFFLLPKVRRELRTVAKYENNLHIIVIIRQILLFLAPLAFSITIFGIDQTTQQLTGLFVLGLSINVFWVVQLPQLTKAHLYVDFAVDRIKDFQPFVEFEKNSEHLVYTRIYNMGYSTLKNAMLLIYFGNDIEIVPSDNLKYQTVDFKKEFTLQRCNNGVGFAPIKNNYTQFHHRNGLFFQL